MSECQNRPNVASSFERWLRKATTCILGGCCFSALLNYKCYVAYTLFCFVGTPLFLFISLSQAIMIMCISLQSRVLNCILQYGCFFSEFSPHFLYGPSLSFLVPCSETTRKRLLRRLVSLRSKFFLLLSQLSRRTSRGNACYAGYVDVISNKQSIFSSHIRTLSFPINWPSLVATARSPNIIYWSHEPSHKHYSNQSKAIVICDHKSDKTRSVAHVNKAYLVWLMFRVLSNQHYQHRTNQKLRSWANAVFQNRGVCGQAVPSFPSPSPVIPFFCSRPNFSRRTRAETLATQATG